MTYFAQVLRGQLNQANAVAAATTALQGHSLQQAPAPKTGSPAGGVHIRVTAGTAPVTAPPLPVSAAGPPQVQQACGLCMRTLARGDAWQHCFCLSAQSAALQAPSLVHNRLCSSISSIRCLSNVICCAAVPGAPQTRAGPALCGAGQAGPAGDPHTAPPHQRYRCRGEACSTDAT